MNLAFLLICFTLFSFKIALSNSVNLIFFAPILFLAGLNLKNLLPVFKTLLKLNFFIAFVVLSLVIYDEFTLAKLIFIRSNLILLFGLLGFYKAYGAV
ncbi:MAG: cobalt ABC transporter permease, partial [Campylobacter sp.]|nr:cobalt ABC transporter permease [Campylobacter sp.]